MGAAIYHACNTDTPLNHLIIVNMNWHKFTACSTLLSTYANVLKPTGYVTHHQFNIQQLYALPTLYLCVLYLSENKQRLVPLTA